MTIGVIAPEIRRMSAELDRTKSYYPTCFAEGGVSSHDPQIAVRPVPALFPQGESENRQAPQSRHLQVARVGGEARTRGAIFQAALVLCSPDGAQHNLGSTFPDFALAASGRRN